MIHSTAPAGGSRIHMQQPQLVFPLYSRQKQPPEIAEKCLVCGRDLSRCDVNITLNAGALPTQSGDYAMMTEGMKAFWDISWHKIISRPNHGNNDISDALVIVEDIQFSQFDLGFCSISCLREFFAQMLDRFEELA